MPNFYTSHFGTPIYSKSVDRCWSQKLCRIGYLFCYFPWSKSDLGWLISVIWKNCYTQLWSQCSLCHELRSWFTFVLLNCYCGHRKNSVLLVEIHFFYLENINQLFSWKYEMLFSSIVKQYTIQQLAVNTESFLFYQWR